MQPKHSTYIPHRRHIQKIRKKRYYWLKIMENPPLTEKELDEIHRKK